MHSLFHIGQKRQIDRNNRLWQVAFTLTNDNDPQLHALTEQMRQETYPQANVWNRLGMLLIKPEQFQKSQEVYDILLDRTTTEREKASMYVQPATNGETDSR
ncbi:unnamed protein product [Rotaria sp. Silwood1]|nr:unnamed protein product [Rotaria sp. Silwood1]